ncbi:uncharacterized protein [Rutidosis leptorrhynchoides]|uniref:uncharacterized protein n=1 Tax=Rutidosis leptorrhynchoides TaxID=125765 RepID=UPI003A98D76A
MDMGDDESCTDWDPDEDYDNSENSDDEMVPESVPCMETSGNFNNDNYEGGDPLPNDIGGCTTNKDNTENVNGSVDCDSSTPKIMSLNIRGFGSEDRKESKIGWFRSMRLKERPNIVLVQESKCNVVDDNWIEMIWGAAEIIIINEVRCQEERQNSRFIERRAKIFNNFIENNHLIEIPLLGKRFTRICDNGKKFSKLDRFLANEEFLFSWGDVTAIALDRNTSDHCPIIIRDNNNDFGPKPFKIFDTWLESKEVEKIIVDAWNSQVHGHRADCIFRGKFKNVKAALKSWSKSEYENLDKDIERLKKETEKFESKADNGPISDEYRENWLKARILWLKKKKEKSDMLKQKSRVKWDTDGDDNTAYFHASIKRRNNCSNIRGLYINGVWDEQPSAIKKEILEFYSKLFKENQTDNPDFM